MGREGAGIIDDVKAGRGGRVEKGIRGRVES
jgi:hypothetical protein